MVKKRGTPSIGELVVCKITKVNPNSAEAYLEEYKKEGSIHVSEVSSGWVRDIRNFVKVGQSGVAKVIRADEKHIVLSLKRVDRKQENEKLKEYKLNQRAEKMLELAAKQLGKTLEQAYEEVGFLLQEKFGTMYDGFAAAMENPSSLKSRGVPEKWIEVLAGIAEKNIEKREFEFAANLHIKTYKPDGIIIIRDILRDLEKSGLEVKYIAAPNYLVKYKTTQAKKGSREFLSRLEKIAAAKDAEVTFELLS